jgi:hypothetical protein
MTYISPFGVEHNISKGLLNSASKAVRGFSPGGSIARAGSATKAAGRGMATTGKAKPIAATGRGLFSAGSKVQGMGAKLRPFDKQIKIGAAGGIGAGGIGAGGYSAGKKRA